MTMFCNPQRNAFQRGTPSDRQLRIPLLITAVNDIAFGQLYYSPYRAKIQYRRQKFYIAIKIGGSNRGFFEKTRFTDTGKTFYFGLRTRNGAQLSSLKRFSSAIFIKPRYNLSFSCMTYALSLPYFFASAVSPYSTSPNACLALWTVEAACATALPAASPVSLPLSRAAACAARI